MGGIFTTIRKALFGTSEAEKAAYYSQVRLCLDASIDYLISNLVQFSMSYTGCENILPASSSRTVAEFLPMDARTIAAIKQEVPDVFDLLIRTTNAKLAIKQSIDHAHYLITNDRFRYRNDVVFLREYDYGVCEEAKQLAYDRIYHIK